eukprot:526523_1
MSLMWNTFPCTPKAVSSNVIQIDETNFAFATESYTGETNEHAIQHGLYSFNILSNEWKLVAKYANSGVAVIPTTFHGICYDQFNHKVYIQGYERKLIACDLKSRRWHVDLVSRQIGSFSQLTVVDGEVHLVGGASNKYHLVWVADKWKQMYRFNWSSGNYGSALLYVKSRKCMLLMGGYDYSVYHKLDSVWCCNTNSLQWSESPSKMPYKVNMFGYVLSYDERFVIIFGGEKENKSNSNEIWILDLHTMTWMPSNVHCPKSACYHAVLISNQSTSTLCVSGWMRMQKLGLPALPLDVLDLICKWYSQETVHLFQRSNNFHWTINLKHIFE